MTPIETYLVAVVHLGLIVAIAYPWHYRRSDWRSTDAGRALMTKAVTLAALFTVAVIGFWWPFPGYDVIYSGIVTAVVGAMTYQFRVMRRLQRDPRNDDF